ncbi:MULTISPECIES: OmpA family protein [unclassified Nocardioides]|uniref:OmpA family protein n=1 Tax=unclassified Nocardioides TaxID=2615069 RepID=UPI00301575CF
MSFTVPSRRVAALAVAASGLATVLSGAFAPAATAAPSSAPAAASATSVTVAAAKKSWFVDPRTPAQRKAQLAVPGNPEKYRGKLRETRAVYRTRDGALAVPMRFAFGNLVSKGQALTLDGGGLFSGGSATLTTSAKAQIRKLADSLTSASSVRCEGYADYSGPAGEATSLSKARAAKVCAQLAKENPGLKTSSVSYGSARPAIVGGVPAKRELNRRVVVEMTGTRPVKPVPTAPQAKVPGAPVLVHADGIDGAVRYGFNAPATDGGSPITGYQVSTGGAWVPVQILLGRRTTTSDTQLTPCRGCGPRAEFEANLGDLSPAQLVNLRVRAVNKVGAGAPSNTLSTTVYGRPSAPTDLEVVGDDGVLTTTFGVPAQDGGSPVAYYEISYDGGQHWTFVPLASGTVVTVVKEGLDNGTTYDVRVRAWNDWGFSPEASVESLVAAVPSAPEIGSPAVHGSVVNFALQAPERNGGLPISGYEVTTDGGQTWDELEVDEDEGLYFSLAGLTFGDEYDVQVRAVNAHGKGKASASQKFTYATVPSAPRIRTSTGDNGTITTVVEPAEHDNGSAITAYEISYDGGETFTEFDTTGTAPWTTVKDGFQNGVEYGVRVRAVNAKGASQSFGALVFVATVPDKVWLDDEPVVTGTRASFTFEAPDFDGGLPVTSYEVSTDGGETWGSFAYAPTVEGFAFDLDDLTLGHAYGVRVRAVNARGPGAGSKNRVVTPIAVPNAPTDVVAVATGTSVKVDFVAPESDSGHPIESYEVSIDGGEWIGVEVSSSAYTFTLTNQTVGVHTYAVRAVNAAGPGDFAKSEEVEVVAEPKPPVVTGYTNTRDAVTIHFREEDVDLAEVSAWQVKIDGGSWTNFTNVTTPWFGGLSGSLTPYPCGGQPCSDVLGTVQVRAALVDGGYSDPSAVYYLPGYQSGGIPG